MKINDDLTRRSSAGTWTLCCYNYGVSRECSASEISLKHREASFKTNTGHQTIYKHFQRSNYYKYVCTSKVYQHFWLSNRSKHQWASNERKPFKVKVKVKVKQAHTAVTFVLSVLYLFSCFGKRKTRTTHGDLPLRGLCSMKARAHLLLPWSTRSSLPLSLFTDTLQCLLLLYLLVNARCWHGEKHQPAEFVHAPPPTPSHASARAVYPGYGHSKIVDNAHFLRRGPLRA